MRAIVWQGPNEMTVEDQPEPPDPGPGELILKPEAVGICGSEVEGYLGHMGNRTPPLVMGHEFAGTVVAGDSELVGQRVAVNPLSGCGECKLCASGHGNLCRDRVLIGVHVPGAFADFVRVPAADARVLPDGVSSRVGALMEPLANGVHAVRLAPPGVECAVVIGAGTIGLVALQAALLHRFADVRVVEPQELRRARARPIRSPARPTSCSTRSAPRAPAGWASSCCARAGRWCASASPTTTRRSASTTSSATSTASRAPTRTRCPTSSRRTSG